MDRPLLIFLGGFLGAGKTTLLAEAAARLAKRGERVGLITNDQATNLVDSEILRGKGYSVEEVGGGCFCCRFEDLTHSAEKLLAMRPTVLMGEPVGSCTDVSATVLQPIKKFFAKQYRVAPLTVLTDPIRLREALDGKKNSALSEKVRYIFAKQLEEADAIAVNKIETVSKEEREALRAELSTRFAHAKLFFISALDGAGVDDWLTYVMKEAPAGCRIAEVDYDIYAEGEAELGWLNAAVRLKAPAALDWKQFALGLLREMKNECAAVNAEVAHAKLHLTAPGVALSGNLTSSRGQPFIVIQGVNDNPSDRALLLLNARVQTPPETLKAAAERVLARCTGKDMTMEIVELECFKPGRPVPAHRFTQPV